MDGAPARTSTAAEAARGRCPVRLWPCGRLAA
jgi:hypothetical protein